MATDYSAMRKQIEQSQDWYNNVTQNQADAMQKLAEEQYVQAIMNQKHKWESSNNMEDRIAASAEANRLREEAKSRGIVLPENIASNVASYNEVANDIGWSPDNALMPNADALRERMMQEEKTNFRNMATLNQPSYTEPAQNNSYYTAQQSMYGGGNSTPRAYETAQKAMYYNPNAVTVESLPVAKDYESAQTAMYYNPRSGFSGIFNRLFG